MDLTQLTDEQVTSLANVGNFAAIAELNRRSAMPSAIERDILRDQQGNIITYNIPQNNYTNYSDSELMESDTTSKSNRGILDVLKFLGQGALGFATGIPFIGQGIEALADQFQYRGADPSITSTPLAQFAFRNQLARDPSFNIGAALDKQNALGGYYSDFARGQRQFAGRFSNLMDRARSGKNFSTKNLLGISNALGMGVTRDDINNIVSGAYDLNTGDGPSGAGTFTAQSLSDSFAGEEGPTSTGTMSASDFSDDTAGTPF